MSYGRRFPPAPGDESHGSGNRGRFMPPQTNPEPYATFPLESSLNARQQQQQQTQYQQYQRQPQQEYPYPYQQQYQASAPLPLPHFTYFEPQHPAGGEGHSPRAGDERYYYSTTDRDNQSPTGFNDRPHHHCMGTPPPVSPRSDISVNSAGAASATTPSKAQKSSPLHTCQHCGREVKVLSRHINDMHRELLNDPPELYPCPVEGCLRAKVPFKRKDNLIQHLRAVHKQDIEKQKPGRAGKSSP